MANLIQHRLTTPQTPAQIPTKGNPAMSIDSVEAAHTASRQTLVIEGHRDCYEQLHWHNMGEQNPVRYATDSCPG
jgi:hypothetical protein